MEEEEYRVSPFTGNIFEKKDFFERYKNLYTADGRKITQTWEEMIPITIPEGISLETLQEKTRYIYSREYLPNYSLFVRDPTRLLKPKHP